jgi:3-oxoacyl-[acyl-carrier protein] reductase
MLVATGIFTRLVRIGHMTEERKVAIVTGSATGIGAASALRLAQDGWNVVINYTKSRTEAEETAEACRAAGAAVAVEAGDVSDDAVCRALAAAALDRWGRIDALVNNAGTTRHVPFDDLEGVTSDDFDRLFSVNVKSAFQMARAAETALREAGGSVVNLSSHSGFSGYGSSIVYAASKGALNTLTMSLARALAPEVRVNAVCPGFVDTRWSAQRMTADDYASFRERIRDLSILKHLVSADDVAEAVAWFAASAPGVTGQLLVVDSGTHLTVNTP